MPDDYSKDPRVYFAAERTFLAWVRTGIALMGFGFVVSRFGLFLREVEATQHVTFPSSPRLSLWIGIGLVLVGVAVNITATVRQARLVDRLKRGEWEVGSQSRIGVALAASLALIGVAMAVYLVVIR